MKTNGGAGVKKVYLSLAGLAAIMAGYLLVNIMGGTSDASLPRDCNSNSIIYCGGITPSELADRYTANKPGDLPAIYNSYGLSSYDMTHAGTVAKMGEVHKDGTVTVNGQLVATDAMSIGRDKFAGHLTPVVINGHTYYTGYPRDTFGIEAIVAYVFFDSNGNFRAAVLTSCGNPVRAHPIPKPVYSCDSLTADKISQDVRHFTVAATANNGASIVNYTYDFGDSTSKTDTATSIDHTYQPGTYTATVTANVSVNGQTIPVTSSNCKVSFTIQPPAPVYSCDALTVTQIDRTHFTFNTKYTAENVTFKGVQYVIKDANGNTIAQTTDANYEQDQAAAYSVQAFVMVNANGQDQSVSSEACTQPFTVIPINMVQVCNVATGQTITVPESEQGNYKPVGDVACQPPAPTPTELPHTGPMDIIGSTVGAGSLIAAIGYYIASRRGLIDQLLGR